MTVYELKRALSGYEFKVSVCIALSLATLQLCFVPLQYCTSEAWSQWRSGANGMPPTVWASWMGATPQSVWSALFYYLSPLLCCAPFAASGCSDLNGGLASILACRSSTREYARAKLFASCVSGMIVFVAPQVLNLLATMLLVPLVAPDPVTMLFPITSRAAAAELFYTCPQCYTALFLALGCAFICLLNCICVLASGRLRSRLAILLLPFLGCMLLNFFLQTVGLPCYSPINLLSPYQQYPGMSLFAAFSGIAAALAATIGYAAAKTRIADVL